MARKQTSTWQGFVNLDKPAGISSGDCVYRLRRLLGERRIGHGGTLDPAAVGVLPVAVGNATRLLPYLPSDKTYRATVRFGICTETDDLEGAVTWAQPVPELDRTRVEVALGAFLGEIDQVPPRYSAIHIGGQRLYDLARRGVAPDLAELPVRRVRIDQLAVVAWRPGEFPELELEIDCSAGTYIRAIARDLGHSLGCGATLAGLVRTRSAGLLHTDSLPFATIEAQLAGGQFRLLGPAVVLAHLPRLDLDGEAVRAWGHGRVLACAGNPGNVQVWGGGAFLGIGHRSAGQLQPTVVLATV